MTISNCSQPILASSKSCYDSNFTERSECLCDSKHSRLNRQSASVKESAKEDFDLVELSEELSEKSLKPSCLAYSSRSVLAIHPQEVPKSSHHNPLL